MSIIIVTKNQYICASQVHAVLLDEEHNYIDVSEIPRKVKRVKENVYTIKVTYTPEDSAVSQRSSSNNHGNGDGTYEACVEIKGYKNAHDIFATLVNQIREQQPDQLYLQKFIDDLLTKTNEIEDVPEFELIPEELLKNEEDDDGSTNKIRGSGKAERECKRVLRTIKKGR